MGNQGMTNWKFTAFLAIALMLVAGLFTNAAIAGNGDGAVGLVVSESVTNYGPDNPIPAASTNSTLVYTYTASQVVAGTPTAIDMSGGAVRLTIPTGWTVPKNMVTVTDGGTNLYLAGAAIAGEDDDAVTGVITSTPLAAAEPGNTDNRRVTVVGGDNITQIEVALDASWAATVDGSPRAAERALIITFVNAIAPAPARLTFPPATSANDQDPPVATYEFTMRSKAKDGVFRRLKPTPDSDRRPATDGYGWQCPRRYRHGCNYCQR